MSRRPSTMGFWLPYLLAIAAMITVSLIAISLTKGA